VVRLFERRAHRHIIFAAIFAITMNVADGARSVPREYLESPRLPLRPPAHAGRHLGALVDPYLLAGSGSPPGRRADRRGGGRNSSSRRGLGYYILYNSRSYHHNEAFVASAAAPASRRLRGAGAVGDRRFMPWYRRDEKPAEIFKDKSWTRKSRPRSPIGDRASSPTAWC